jgi:HD-GYP domain-containing protein (c-di-GMP phosphodiesterase class II)
MIRIAEIADVILNPAAGQARPAASGTPSAHSVGVAGPRPAPEPPGRPASLPSEAAALFASLEAFTNHIQALATTGGTPPWDDLADQIDRVVAHLADSNDLFWVATARTAETETDYLAFHHARVAVMAVRVGANLGYDRTEQRALGMAGCLFDLGLAGVPTSLLRTAEGLPPSEHALHRDHPRRAAALIHRWVAPYPSIEPAVLHHHELEHGQGYPEGLTGAAIHPHGKIIGLLDLYTRLTVPPSWQPPRPPHDAVREILRSRHAAFASELIKALLMEISVFPPGTQVRLSTGETARVLEANRHQPLRPKVELPGGRQVDLRETPFLYIRGAAGGAE